MVVAVIVVAFVFSLTSPLVKQQLDIAIVWAERIMEANPTQGAIVFLLLSILSATLSFTSSTILVPSANLAWGRTVTFFLLWAGYIGGAVMAYGIGRLARPLIGKLGYEKKLAEYQDFADKKMNIWTVLLICVAAQSELSGYFFGGLHFSFWKYIGAMVVVEAFYAYLITVAGHSFLQAKPVTMLISLAVFVAMVFIAGWILRRMKRKHHTETREN